MYLIILSPVGRWLHRIILLTAALFLGSVCAQPEDSPSASPPLPPVPKLVWAHYAGWGFDFLKYYENPVQNYFRLLDHPLLGPWADTDIGAGSTVRLEVLSALQYGIDGFAVDILKPEAYASALRRFYEAAEGLPFHIALCVDDWGDTPINEVVEALADYFKRWGNHPNNFYINGKPVVFVYKLGRPISECAEILRRLHAKGCDAYWLVQSERETTLWENKERMRQILQTFDGLYDFGINGFSVAKMKQRLSNGRKGLEQYRPNGLLVAGITQGYAGSLNSFYRPSFGTRTLRDNWEAAISQQADWVCVTTWNDFWENTQFLPSEWNRDALLRINQEYARIWRGEAPVPSPPSAIISYRHEVRLGDPWSIEILSLPHTTTDKAMCHVELLDQSDESIVRFQPISLAEGLSAFSRLLQAPGIDTPRLLRVRAAITTKGRKPKASDWKELYPVVVRTGTILDMKTMRFPLDEIVFNASAELEGRKLRASLESYHWVGRADLLRNGYPVERVDHIQTNNSQCKVTFNLENYKAELPTNVYVVRFTRADDRFCFTQPVTVEQARTDRHVSMMVPTRELPFDEAWIVGKECSTQLRNVRVSDDEIYGFRFRFAESDSRSPKDDFGWNVGARGGGTKRGGYDTNGLPAAKVDLHADGTVTKYFAFDGEASCVSLRPRSLPQDVMTCEAVIRPRPKKGPACVFSDQNKAFEMGLAENGCLYLQRGEQRLESKVKVVMNKWSHIAGVYDGKCLILYLNGEKVAEMPCESSIFSINSMPMIGCRNREYFVLSDFFAGDIAGIAVVARPLSPNQFQFGSSGNVQL